ncbi:MAG: sulfatase-like hydrolase/transferase [Lentisphaeria bacterium]|nr:sulfatase-like hydrolase/transferase [Lentisphaeria bacterium]
MNKNILLITSDQHHYSLVGYNNPKIKTPNLDRLAAQGMIFERAYCPNPTCTPSRASIITGTYPSQHGAWALGTKLPEDAHTVGDDFRAAGYRTALVGKGHFQPIVGTEEFPSVESREMLDNLDYWRQRTEPYYGFEEYELNRDHGNGNAGQHYAIWLEESGHPAVAGSNGIQRQAISSESQGSDLPEKATKLQGLTNWRDYFGNDDAVRDSVWSLPEEFHYSTWIAERANARLEEYKRNGDNFFLWVSHPDPHGPHVVPERWAKMYDPAMIDVPTVTEGEHDKNPYHFQITQQVKPDRSMYVEEGGSDCHGIHSHLSKHTNAAEKVAILYAQVSMLDHYIGKTLDKLDELGLAEDTLVVFTADHGDFFGQHGLRGKGAFHYEDMIKLPFVARLPGVTEAGARTDALLSLVDLAPTFLDVAGLPIPRAMTGRSQRPVLEGSAAAVRDHIMVENHHQPTTLHLKTYVNARYKLTVYYNQTYGELFDLEADRGEVNNLWDDPASQALKQDLMLNYIHAELGKEPMWMPRLASA